MPTLALSCRCSPPQVDQKRERESQALADAAVKAAANALMDKETREIDRIHRKKKLETLEKAANEYRQVYLGCLFL